MHIKTVLYEKNNLKIIPPVKRVDILPIAERIKCSDIARDLIKRHMLEFVDTHTPSSFIIISVKELGFEMGARYEDICYRAIEAGLKMCEIQDVFFLIKFCHDSTVLAMEASLAPDKCLDVLVVKCFDGHFEELTRSSGHPGKYWSRNQLFIFKTEEDS